MAGNNSNTESCFLSVGRNCNCNVNPSPGTQPALFQPPATDYPTHPAQLPAEMEV